VNGLLAYWALDRPGGLPEHRPGAKDVNGLLAYCAFVYTVMTSFCHAYDTEAHQLRESKAYYAFDEAWRDASKNAMADLVPNLPPDKSSLNSSSLNTGRRDGPAPFLSFCIPAQKIGWKAKKGSLYIVIKGGTCFCKCADVSSDQQRAFLARRESRPPESLMRRRRIGQ
jgi:hypothetical protein